MRRTFMPLLAFAALPASAQDVQYFHIQSGTGFFVSDDGFLVTNHHVIVGCEQVTVKGSDFPETTGTIRAIDPDHDLALIHVDQTPPGVAELRDNIADMNAGDKVLTIGYPGDAWKTGLYKVADAALVDTKGPKDHPDWIQFSDSVQHGNSGGPLLDESGNVIGVVVAKVYQTIENYTLNRKSGQKEIVSATDTESDAAIGLPTVESFLNDQGVGFRSATSGVTAGDYSIERVVRDYIVNVQCRIPTTASQHDELQQQMEQEKQKEQQLEQHVGQPPAQ